MPSREVEPLAKKEIEEECDFCTLPETKGTEPFRRMYGTDQVIDIPEMPDRFLVMQDVVPLGVEGGHLLLIPKRVGKGHNISLAIIEDQEELATATDKVIGTLRKGYPENPIFTFEHGPGYVQGEQIACGGCHLDHAHGHMVVLPEGTQIGTIKQSMESILDESGWRDIKHRGQPSENVFTNIADITSMNPYLQVGMINKDNSRSALTYMQQSRQEHVESQLLRRVISDVIFKQNSPTYWHYRDVQDGLTSPGRLNQLKEDIVLFRSRINQGEGKTKQADGKPHRIFEK